MLVAIQCIWNNVEELSIHLDLRVVMTDERGMMNDALNFEKQKVMYVMTTISPGHIMQTQYAP